MENALGKGGWGKWVFENGTRLDAWCLTGKVHVEMLDDHYVLRGLLDANNKQARSFQ